MILFLILCPHAVYWTDSETAARTILTEEPDSWVVRVKGERWES